MKNLFYIVLLTLILVSCESSCGDVNDNFINSSGKNIEVIVYKNYYNNIPFETYSKRHIIPNNSSINQTVKSCLPVRDYPNIGDLFQGDSIIIDFGDKKLRYGIKNLSSLRNPFYLAQQNRNLLNFSYTLTPEDYSIAQ